MNVLNLTTFFLLTCIGIFYIRTAFEDYKKAKREPQRYLIYSDFVQTFSVGLGCIFIGLMHFLNKVSWPAYFLEMLKNYLIE